MIEILQAIVLGVVQGLTEFLPISSSGHLFLVPKLLGWEGAVNTLSFDVALHVGTTVAVIVFFWKDWWELIGAFFKNVTKGIDPLLADEKSKLLILIVIGSIPAGVIGFLFENFFENEGRNLPLVAFCLILFGLLLFLADHLGEKTRKLNDLKFSDAIVMGLSQALALIPGVSRSGITITTGLFRNFDRYSAAKFSFLLSTPTIVGAALLKMKDLVGSSSNSQEVFIAGTLSAAISGLLTIKILLSFVQTNNFNVFVVYRVVLGLAVFAWVIGI